MREIKFRVWHPDDFEMHYFKDFVEIVMWQGAFAFDGRIDQYRSENPELGSVTFMQFTGSKDFNGVEIYEGDILQSTMDETYKSVVEFCAENVGSCGCCYNEFEGTGFKAKDLRFNEAIVIGNIYKDSHLLNQAQLTDDK